MSDEIIKESDKINNLLINLGNEIHYNSRCSDRDILTLMVLKIFCPIKSDKHFHRLIKEKFIEEFPNLPEYSAFLKRTKKLSYLDFKLIEEILFESRENSSIVVKLFYRWSLPDRD